MISRLKKQLKGAAILGALLMGSNAFAQLGLTWTELGPNNVGGRCRALIVDKTDATGNTLYTAGVSGGIFKSTNAGGSWSKINDQAQSLIVSCMDQDAGGNIYFGTGEGFTVIDGYGSSGFLGNGLFKMASNSMVITQLKDETFFGTVNEVAVSGSNVYVACKNGFFISTDGGANFAEETISATSTLSPEAHDVKIANNGDVYYTSWNSVVVTGTVTAGQPKIYYAPNGSTSFSDITPSAFTGMDLGRVEVAVSPVNLNYVYASAASYGGSLGAILVSNNKGGSWATIALGTSSSQFDPFVGGRGANYNNTIVADSKQADACFVGGFYLYKWTQNTSSPFGQGTWKQIGSPFAVNSQLYIHNGIHDMKFMPNNLDFYYLATDGGIFKVAGYPLANLGIEYTPFIPVSKGLNISQFYSVAIPNYPRTNVVSGNENVPFQGIGGGCDGNNFTYLSGAVSTNTQNAITLGTSNAYQSDFSKLIPKAIVYSTRNGAIFRSNDVESSTPPSTFYDVSYKLAVSGGPGSSNFAAENTPMRLWENYKSQDSMLFYNAPATVNFLTNNATQTTFTFSTGRGQRSAKYDTIYVRTKSDKKAFKSTFTATNTFTNNNPSATSFTVNNLRTNTISKYDSVTINAVSAKLSYSTIATFTNMNTSVKSFSVPNTRLLPSQRYQWVIIDVVSSKTTPTIAPKSMTITPNYNLAGSIISYAVTGATTPATVAVVGSPNAIYPSATLNDSIRFSFLNPVNDSCVITVKVKYRQMQTIYLYPSYTGSVITNVSASGDANTSTATNNTITLNNSTLNDAINFTFNDPQTDSSVVTVRCKNNFYQQFKIIPAYTGTNITSYTVIGDASPTPTTNINIKLNNTLDTIKYTFRVAPNDSCTIMNTIKYRYNAGDSINVLNTDISGQNFWTSKVLTAPLSTNTKNPYAATVKLPLAKSARIAVGINGKTGEGPAVFVVKRPLNFSVNPDWVRVAGKNSRMDGPGGVATPNSSTTVTPIIGNTITKLEWSPSGKYIYFSTVNTTTAGSFCYLYRVSHLEMVSDSMGDDYSGIFCSDVDSLSLLRKSTGIRTTPIGKFPAPITSIAVAGNDSMLMLTFGLYGNPNTVYYSNGHAGKLNPNSTDDSNFSPKTGSGLPVMPVYTGLLEMNDNKRAIIGTEQGIYSTMDITQASPVWVKESTGLTANDPFPNVPVFQIRQQTLEPYKCYNSGVIYAATHGRGIWTTDKYFMPNYIGIEEHQKDNLSFDSNIRLFPNPATNSTNIWFKAAGDANYRVTVYDINGRTLIQQTTGKLMEGEQLLMLNTSELNSGIYFVSINGTNNFNANTKLVITK